MSDASSVSSSFSAIASKLATKSMAVAAIAKEKSKVAATQLQEQSVGWRERAAEIKSDVSAKAKEAYEAARKTELYGKGASYFASSTGRRESYDSNSGGSYMASSTLSSRRSADMLAYPPVFGVPLSTALERSRIEGLEEDIPAIVYRCIEYIEDRALDEVGIYRLSGSSTAVASLKNAFNVGGDHELFESENTNDPNTVCSVLKAFFRECEYIPSWPIHGAVH
ncbi:hypothetical protein HDV05_005871 [Chytridiales sp. JEL 0842]|nr:hypothetical protein HDV05_005871 [Chytridiales sp. JEL 0842]